MPVFSYLPTYLYQPFKGACVTINECGDSDQESEQWQYHHDDRDPCNDLKVFADLIYARLYRVELRLENGKFVLYIWFHLGMILR